MKNYTQVPNDLFDRLIKIKLPGQQMQCLLAIVRKTHGFHKESDWIAASQMAKLTGICERNCRRALKALDKKNIIEIVSPEKIGRTHKNQVRISSQFIEKGDNLVTVYDEKKGVRNDTVYDEKGGRVALLYDDEKGGKVEPERGANMVKKRGAGLPPTKEKETKETTTTETSCCGEESFFKSEEKEAAHCGLSTEQENFIKYKVAKKKADGEIKKSPGEYKYGLVKAALIGKLDMTDYEDLKLDYEINLLGDYTTDTMHGWNLEEAEKEIRAYLTEPWEEREITYKGEKLIMSGQCWNNYLREYHGPIYYQVEREAQLAKDRKHIQQRISEGVSIEEIIEKVMDMPVYADHRHRYTEILRAEYPKQWAQRQETVTIAAPW